MSSGATTGAPTLVPFPRWQKARDRASAALLAGVTRLVVTGPAGTGKTVLLDHVARVLRGASWTVVIQLADAEPSLPDHDGPVALLVDEADRLSPERLDELLRTTRVPLLLAGLDSLAGRVADATRISLTKLEVEESRDYIATWLAAAGRTPEELETAAMRRIIGLSRGVPRLLSSLLTTSTWLADNADEAVVTLRHVEEAAELRACFQSDASSDDVKPAPVSAIHLTPPAARRRGVVAPVLAAMLLLGAGGFAASRFYSDDAAGLIDAAGSVVTGLRQSVAVAPSGTDAPAAPQPIVAVAHAADVAAAPTPQLAPVAAPVVTETVALESVAAEPTPAAMEEPAIAAQPAETAPVAARAPTPEPVAFQPATQRVEQVPNAPSVAAQTRTRLPGATSDLLLRRGREMMGIGDISAARLLFSRVADAGDTEAMIALGKTYDPASLASAGVLMQPDPAEAARWYRRAAADGSDEAVTLLSRLSQQSKH